MVTGLKQAQKRELNLGLCSILDLDLDLWWLGGLDERNVNYGIFWHYQGCS